jgi:heat shock protein HslJ
MMTLHGRPKALVIGMIVGMGLLLAGCTTGEAETSNDLLGSSWLAEDIEGQGVMDILQTTIGFDVDDRIAGSGGCNNYFGLAVIKGSTISMGPLGSTQKACPPAIMDQEQHINIGSGHEVTIADLAHAVKAAVGFEGALGFDASKPDGTARKLLDVSRLESLGWQAQTRLEDGLRRTYAWLLENPDFRRSLIYTRLTPEPETPGVI